MKKFFSHIAHCYLESNYQSRDDHAQALKSFTDHIIDNYRVNLVSVDEDSVGEGNLDKVAERYLVTNEMRKEHDKNKKQTMTKT